MAQLSRTAQGLLLGERNINEVQLCFLPACDQQRFQSEYLQSVRRDLYQMRREGRGSQASQSPKGLPKATPFPDLRETLGRCSFPFVVIAAVGWDSQLIRSHQYFCKQPQ